MSDNRLLYEDTGLPATNLLKIKILLNSTTSDTDKGIRFILADIKDYFLAILIEKPEYMHVKY